MSMRAAASQYNIPKSTLHDHVVGNCTTNKAGPSPVLTEEEEEALVDWIVHMAKIGYGRTSEQVFEMVKKIWTRQVALICLLKIALENVGGMPF